MSIKAVQEQTDEWIRQNGVRYFNELTNLAILTEEVGEVARIISRTYGEQSWKPGKTPAELGPELADVLFVLLCLANQTGTDLEKEFQNSLIRKSARDRDRHQNNPKLKDKNHEE